MKIISTFNMVGLYHCQQHVTTFQLHYYCQFYG